MEKSIEVKSAYNSLDTLSEFLKKESEFECSTDYDRWDMRTDANGQMEKCIILKKSGMHAAKLYFEKENTVRVNHIIPNKLMNAYFGRSVKARRNILEIAAGAIKQNVLASSQKEAFEELTKEISKAAL